MKFAAKLLALNNGGELITDSSSLHVNSADELHIIFTGATAYNIDKLNFDRTIDPLLICNEILTKAENKSNSLICFLFTSIDTVTI